MVDTRSHIALNPGLATGRSRRRWHGPSRRRSSLRHRSWITPVLIFGLVFALTTYALTPEAPGKAHLAAEWRKRTTDQSYAGCPAARANHHTNILAFEPSYRPHMDRDGDGRACEPWVG